MKEYSIIRSSRRTVCIEVNRKGVIIRGPFNLTDSEAERIYRSREEWITKSKEKFSARRDPFEMSNSEKEQTRHLAKEYIPSRVAEYANRFGFVYTKVHIGSAKTRWGSCSAKGTLSFSLYLMRYPVECIDAVILHELVHTRHRNHKAEFYDELLSLMPDYYERIKVLGK